ncbi:hypothetical protein F4604DRAFT_1877253 [Suillus subluteus]|nr:hypothetical protein F4604DRAFT_1877253 [Suillus subluteus]
MGHLFGTFHLHMTTPPPTHRTPYNDRVEFETAEFLFMRNQMSAKQINTLLDLWAVTLIKHNDAPPFTNQKDVYATINATPLGDVPWKMFSMCYSGIKPEWDVPPWMDVKYDIWYRDLLQIVHSMLANPAFDRGIKYSPYCDYTNDNKQYWKNFMSGDWA